MQFLYRSLLSCFFIMHAMCLVYGQSLTGETKILVEQKLEYRVDLPQGYREDGPAVPVLLFLHGGDRSNTKHHPMKYARQAKLDFPFMVVAPHCSNGCSWGTVDFDALLRQVLNEYNADPKNIYITGYSFGGYGTWSAITRFPDWFAAAAPIAGGGNENTICTAAKVKVRAYHGTNDSVTPYAGSARLIKTLQDCGAEADLISIDGADHWIWPDLFKDQQFYSWLLQQSKQN